VVGEYLPPWGDNDPGARRATPPESGGEFAGAFSSIVATRRVVGIGSGIPLGLRRAYFRRRPKYALQDKPSEEPPHQVGGKQ